MADVIIIEYQAEVDSLIKETRKAEQAQLSLDKGAKATSTNITKGNEKAAQSIDKVNKNVVTLKDKLSELSNRLPFAGMVKDAVSLGDSIRASADQTVKAGNSWKIFNTILKASPIVFLVGIFASLVSYFKSTEEGGDRLAKIFRVLNAIFGELVKGLSAVGGFLVDLVISSENATVATDDYRKSVVQLAEEIADLEDKISALTITIERQNDKLQTLIEINLKALRNRSITLKESEKVIKNIGDLEEQKLKNATDLINKKIELERKEFILKTKDFGDDKQRIEELQAAEIRLLKQEAGFRRDMQLKIAQDELSRYDAVIQKNREKAKIFDKFINDELTAEQVLDQAKGTYTEEDLKRVAAILKEREAVTRESLVLDERLQNFRDAAIERDKARITDEQKAYMKAAKEKAEFDKNYHKLRSDLEIKDSNTIKENLKEQHDARVKEMKRWKQEVGDPLINAVEEEEKRQTEIILQEEARRKQLRQQGLSEALNLFSTTLNDFAQLQQAKANAEIDSERQANQDKYNSQLDLLNKKKDAGIISEEQFNAKKNALDKIQAKRESDLKRKQFEADQKAAILRVNISTAEAIAKSLATYGFTPPALIAAAGAIASGEVQKAFIRAQPVPKFKEGVIDFKGKGTGTSDSNLAMISKGESVMTAKETREHRGALKAMRNDEFDKYMFVNFVKPALEKERKRNKEQGQINKLMQSMALNGLGDTSHLERLTKSNKKVIVENLSILPSQIGKEVERSLRNNSYMK